LEEYESGTYLRVARELFASNELDDSITAYLKYLEINSNERKIYLLNKDFDKCDELDRKNNEIYLELSKTYLVRANYFFSSNNVDASILDYKQSFKFNPHNEMAYLRLSQIYLTKCEYGKSAHYFENFIEIGNNGKEFPEVKNKNIIAKCTQALNIDQNFVLAYGYMAQAYYDNGEYNKASESIEKAIELFSDDMLLIYGQKSYTLLGLSYYKLNKYNLAFKSLKCAIEHIDDFEVKSLLNTNELNQSIRFEEIDSLTKKISKDSNNRNLYFDRGISYLNRGIVDAEQYYKSFRGLEENNPSDKEIPISNFKNTISLLLAAQESFKLATDDFIKIIKLTSGAFVNQSTEIPHYELALVSCHKQEYDQAIKHYEDITENVLESALDFYKRINKTDQDPTNDEEKKIFRKCFLKVIKFDSTLGRIFRDQGVVYIIINQYEKAYGSLDVAIKAGNNAYLERGIACFYLNLANDAIIDITEAIKLDKKIFRKNALAHYYRGLAYFQLEQYRQAINDFTVAIDDDGDLFSSLYYYRATAYLNKKSFVLAAADFERALEIEKDPEILILILSAKKVAEELSPKVEVTPETGLLLPKLPMYETQNYNNFSKSYRFSFFGDSEQYECLENKEDNPETNTIENTHSC
jgi:tetratricopeptide (TPR) repeat protein